MAQPIWSAAARDLCDIHRHRSGSLSLNGTARAVTLRPLPAWHAIGIAILVPMSRDVAIPFQFYKEHCG